MKGEDRMICHFYRENWPCKVNWQSVTLPSPLHVSLNALHASFNPLHALIQVMDKHMGILAKKHIETKFVKVNEQRRMRMFRGPDERGRWSAWQTHGDRSWDLVCRVMEFRGVCFIPMHPITAARYPCACCPLATLTPPPRTDQC